MKAKSEGYTNIFPYDLRQPSIPEWKVLLALTYDGPSTMYDIHRKYGFKYALVHRAIKGLEEIEWVTIIEKKPSLKGGKKKVYSLTMLGLLHILYRIPHWFGEYNITPNNVKRNIIDLHTQEDVVYNISYCFRVDEAALNNRKLLPLIFGKWDRFKKRGVSDMVFARMIPSAYSTLTTHHSGRNDGVVLHEVFAYHVYHNLLIEALYIRDTRKKEGYADFDYRKIIQEKIIKIFQNEPELTKLFREICTKIEEDITSVIKSIKKIKVSILKEAPADL